jgi:hypothetical protein
VIKPSIVRCLDIHETSWLLRYLREHGYGRNTPAFVGFVQSHPDYTSVIIHDHGHQVNTRGPDYDAPVVDSHWLSTRHGLMFFPSIRAFIISNRNVTITGVSLVRQYV